MPGIGISNAIPFNKGVSWSSYWTKLRDTETASLLALWRHDDLSGAVLVDSSGNGFNGTYHAVTLGETGIGDSATAAKYDGATSYTSIQSAGLNAAFDKTEVTIITWIKVKDATIWANTGYRYFVRLAVNNNNSISLHLGNAAGFLRAAYIAGSTSKYLDRPSLSYLDWFCVALTISKSNDRLRLYINGCQYLTDITGLGTWSGDLSNSYSAIGSQLGVAYMNGLPGWIGPTAIWKKELTANQVATLSSYKRVKGILFVGDSKTANEAWRTQACDLLNADDTNNFWTERPHRVAVSGITTAQMAARVDADIVAMSGVVSPVEVSINLGANDCNGATLTAGFDTNTRYIVNAYHAAFPSANIRLTKIWKRDCEVAVAAANVIIDSIYADYSWMKAGIDEATFLEGGDDGATYTTDGTHPNAAGGLLEAAALKAVIYP